MICRRARPRSATSALSWRDTGLFGRINHHLVMADRERVGREVLTVCRGPRQPKHQDDGERRPARLRCRQEVKGRKRQALVDMDGRALVLDPQPADVQDRDGAVPVLRLSRRTFPFIAKAFADAGYAATDRDRHDHHGRDRAQAAPSSRLCRASTPLGGRTVSFAWIRRNRRLWKDPEATIASARAFLYAAAVMILVRRLARSA